MTVPEPVERDKRSHRCLSSRSHAKTFAAALARNVSEFTTGTEAEQVGRIAEVGDASHGSLAAPGHRQRIARVRERTVCLALNLDEESIARSFGSEDGRDEGQVSLDRQDLVRAVGTRCWAAS